MISRLINQRYEVLERTGEGTFFQVFKARDKVTGRVVAIKLLQSVYAHDEAFCEALRKSSADMATLTHPNIARFYELGEEEGVPFLVTEFVRGINLKERIRRIAPFTLSVAVDFAIAIGEAVQSAHAAGLCHGDLRPHNVIVSPEGAVKVTDFGLAGVASASPQFAASNLGRAAHYLSPEVAAGQPVSTSSDIYGLGVILFEMLTGALPYPGETPLIAAMKQQNDPVPSPRVLNPGVPRSLEGIVMKALQKTPAQRYASIGDLLNDLKSVRDALRFGKPLSWSPMENEKAVPAAGGTAGAAAAVRTAAPAATLPKEAVAANGTARMSATTTSDDRIAPWLRYSIIAMMMLVFGVVVFAVAAWMVVFTKPPSRAFPNVIGMKYDDAQRKASAINVRLMRRDEFNDKYAPDVIYRSEWEPGRVIPAGRSVLVWVSKGSRMVWVPNLANIQAEDADTKLKAEGLTLGEVNRQNDKSVPFGYVVKQNPRAGKRVSRDTPINLVISDGPAPGEEATSADTSGTDNSNSDNTGASPDATGTTSSSDNSGDATDLAPRSTTLQITVKRDGLGRRRVQVQYDDAQGTHTPIDEYHNEGDVIKPTIEVSGPTATVRVYYGDPPMLKKETTLNLGGGGQ